MQFFNLWVRGAQAFDAAKYALQKQTHERRQTLESSELCFIIFCYFGRPSSNGIGTGGVNLAGFS